MSSRASRSAPLRARDAHLVLHDLLQLLLHAERIATALARERSRRGFGGGGQFRSRDVGKFHSLRLFRGRRAGALTEDDEIRERIPAEPIAPMEARGDFTRRVQAGNACRGGLRVDLHAAHRVVGRRPHLHRVGGNVDAGEFLELVIHTRELGLDVLRAPLLRDVQKHAAVRAAAPGLDLGDDRFRHDITGEQFGGRRLATRSPSTHRSASSSLSA